MGKAYLVIGMSPGNSYFKEVVVRELLAKAIKKYKTSVRHFAKQQMLPQNQPPDRLIRKAPSSLQR